MAMLSSQEIVEERKVIVFRLADEEFGVEVSQVRSIERMQTITRIPRTLNFMKGVINLRGVVTPIIDLKERLELSVEEVSDSTRIIVVGVENMEIGLIVDEANEVIDIPANVIAEPPAIIGGVKASYLSGVAKLENRLLIMLNLNKVLNNEEIRTLTNLDLE